MHDQLGCLDYDVVDVFTDRAYAGNPLAVVHGAGGLTPSQLQALAREFNLSETTFPTLRSETAYDVRIFTPDTEIPFAGHPSVGTAWLLRSVGQLDADEVVQHCGAGEVPVQVRQAGAELAATPQHVHRRDDASDLAAAVGLGADDVEGAAYEASCGLAWTFLRVRADAVARSRPSPPGWLPQSRAPDPMGGLAVVAVTGPGTSWAGHARVFFPSGGVVVEDPATGSAAAALGLVLAADGTAAAYGTTSYTIAQGAEIGRPSTLTCRVDVAAGRAVRVHVAGGVAHVASGRIAVPPNP
ncbi:MAG: PhzF family phenazine biosynthesis protein [Actinomycetota bacterium]|nr:PhzF family phenazine biosynthesis protein [Actinomycetota bacterium]